MKAVDDLDTDHERVIQFGYSTFGIRHSTAEQFFPFDEIRAYMLSAEVVITHSGTGSVMLALSLGKKPIVAPRYKKYGEHVDDHQLQLVQQLESDDLIVPFYDGDNLRERVEQILSGAILSRNIEPDPRLVQDLTQYINNP